MSLEEADYPKVSDRVAQLNCHMPTGLAILPENFETAASSKEFLVRGEASTIKTIFRNAKIPLDTFQLEGEKPRYIHNKAFDWGVTIFIAAGLLSNDPNTVTVALGMISTLLTDFFKGVGGETIKFSVVVEKSKDKTCKKLTYEGNVEGLSAINDAIRRIADE